jgi:hypothetical protein
VSSRGSLIDLATQKRVRFTGQSVSLTTHPWLVGPVGDPHRIGDEWLVREAARLDGTVIEGGGLLADLSALAGDGFDPSALAPPIVEFYEATSLWRMEVWSQWCPVAWPFGWLLSAVFARRLEQLALPLRPLDVARGMDSRVVAVRDQLGTQLGAAWLRTLRSTGQTVYSGWYGTTTLPEARQPSVRVAFPLPNGSVTVFLRPENGPDGSLILSSPLARFGSDGAYLIVAKDDGSGWSRRVPLAERFHVYLDEEGVLRTDHALNLWHLPVIRLHYRLDRHPG